MYSLPLWNATGSTDVLASTMECHWPYGCTRFNGGRGLGPDGGVPDTAALAEPLQSGASPLPHWNDPGLTDVLAPTMECHWPYGCTRFNCGRGLAPDGDVPDTAVLAEPLQSGASPLPHWNTTGLTDVLAPTMECHWPDGCTRFNCGRGLAPDGGVPDTAVLAEPLQSGAGPSHIGILFVSGECICPNSLIVAL